MIVMGILNVTPDSFSDGGRYTEVTAAVQHAQRMWDEGAAIIDVGAESTRPGARRVSPEEEWMRLKAVVPELVKRGMTVSVDTVNAETAARSVEAGAHYINDVSGGCYDPRMLETVARLQTPYIVQHWRGFPSDPHLDCHYDSVEQILHETLTQVEQAQSAGVDPSQIIIDPGLGFAMEAEDCWRVVNALGSWVATGYPVMVGASRKRFIRERYGDNVLAGTLEVTRQAQLAGAWAVRVHDVKENVEVA